MTSQNECINMVFPHSESICTFQAQGCFSPMWIPMCTLKWSLIGNWLPTMDTLLRFSPHWVIMSFSSPKLLFTNVISHVKFKMITDWKWLPTIDVLIRFSPLYVNMYFSTSRLLFSNVNPMFALRWSLITLLPYYPRLWENGPAWAEYTIKLTMYPC